ncbi:MAG TPA: TolC family protein [Candidatus Binatia bacterium]|nr:TolC family protein [Candidatus Binatia bacterium]
MRDALLFAPRAALFLTALLPLAALPARAQDALTLSSAVHTALDRNPQLRAAGEDERAAAARALGARSAWYPRIDFSQGFTRGNNPVYVFGTLLTQRRFTADNFALPSLNAPHPLDNFDTRFSGHMTLFDSGRTWLRTRAANSEKTAADFALEQARQDLILRVVQAYFGAVVARDGLAAARDARKTAAANRERIASLEHAGQVVSSDLLSAQVFEAQALDRELRAENALAVARLNLGRELGADGEALGAPSAELAEPADLEGAIGEWENEALAARPLLRAVEMQVDAARKGERLAKVDFGPTIGLFGEFERDALTLGGPSGTNWTAGVRLDWNIFAGGANRYQVAEAAAMKRKAEDQLEWVRSGVRLELRRAYLESEAARARAAAARQSTEQARESLRIIENRYQAGLTTITELLRAQEAALEARAGYVTAVGDWYAARASLERAAGRLTPESPILFSGERP